MGTEGRLRCDESRIFTNIAAIRAQLTAILPRLTIFLPIIPHLFTHIASICRGRSTHVTVLTRLASI